MVLNDKIKQLINEKRKEINNNKEKIGKKVKISSNNKSSNLKSVNEKQVSAAKKEKKFNYGKDDVFYALIQGIPEIEGMKIEKKDKVNGYINAKREFDKNRTLGDTIDIYISEVSPGVSQVIIMSKGKLGVTSSDFGNLARIFAKISEVLYRKTKSRSYRKTKPTFRTPKKYSPQNPQIKIEFHEKMPGITFNVNHSYINGILEIADKELIIHKRGWRSKDLGEKHLRYDKIMGVDYNTKVWISPTIQIYMSSVEYIFRSTDKRLKKFYEMILDKVNERETKNADRNENYSPLDELKKLAELKDMGIVTEEEFELKKKQLLGL